MSKAGYAQRIRARANELRKIIATAQAELNELEVAERVIERLAVDQPETQDFAQLVSRRTKEPTIGDMAVKFLQEIGPLATPQLLEHMREHWRADLGDTTLTSTLSRTKNAGRIDYREGMWHAVEAPKQNEGAAAPSDANPVGAQNTEGVLNLQPSRTPAHEKGDVYVASRQNR